MELANVTVNTLIPLIPSIISKNNETLKNYLDLFYDEKRGLLIKPIETTGRVKAGNGEFVNMVVDNLTVKSQYTNLYDNITTADFDFYKTITSPAFTPRDASTTYKVYENPAYKYIDVQKPYYLISNKDPLALQCDNLSQVVHLIFDTSTNLSNDFVIHLDSSGINTFRLPIADAQSTYVEFIMTKYDYNIGPFWKLYKYGSLDASWGGGGSEPSPGQNITIGDVTQIPFVTSSGTDFQYSNSLTWDGTRLTVGGANLYVGDNAGNGSGRFNVMLGMDSGKVITTGSNQTFVGFETGKVTNSGSNSTFIGYRAGFSNIVGSSNTYLGANAGYYSTGSNNVFVGANAGYKETDSNIFTVDNQIRSSQSMGKTSSLIYGTFNSNPNNQIIRFNSLVEVPKIPSDNTKKNIIYFDISTGRLSYGINLGADTSVYYYDNGISKNDASIQLGGALTKTTTLTYNNTKSSLTFDNSNGNFDYQHFSGSERLKLIGNTGTSNDPYFDIYAGDDHSNYGEILVNEKNVKLVSKNASTGLGEIIFDASGARYSKDFRTYYSDRTLVDKAYVDFATSGGLEVSLGSSTQITFMNDNSTGFKYSPNFTYDGRRLGLYDNNNNILIGRGSLQSSTSANNIVIGSNAAYSYEGNNSIFIGNGAGYHSIDSSIFVLHNSIKNSEPLVQTESLIYGEFKNEPYYQLFRINAQVEIPHIQIATDKTFLLYWNPSDGKIEYSLAPTGAITVGTKFQIPFVNELDSDFWYSDNFIFDNSNYTLDVSAKINTTSINISTIEASTYENALFYNPSTGELGYGIASVTTSNTFSNGLSIIDASVTLGGSLDKNTEIDLSTNTFKLYNGTTLISDLSVGTFNLATNASLGYYLKSDASGNGTWAEVISGSDVSFGSNTYIPFMNDSSNFSYSDKLTFDGSLLTVDGSIKTTDLIVDGSTISNEVTVLTYQYMGNKDSDGSWRFFVDSSYNLAFEKRVSGNWVVCGKFGF